jgi:GAF domain-containing protein
MPVPGDDADVAATLATVARSLAAEEDLSAVILRACRLAVETIERCAHADVMIVGEGKALSVPAATDWVGTRVVSIEQQLDEGPCIDAYETGAIVDMPDVETETRWPVFIPRCLADTPVRSGLGLPLVIGDRPIGALDLYADEANAFTDEDRAIAALFASHTAIAFAAARAREQFERALATRDIIGQAKGVLMAQSRVSADEAFELLRRASQRMNRKRVQVAQDIVEKTGPA